VLKTLKEPASKESSRPSRRRRRQRDKAKTDAEQARKDRILLDSYTTEAEIDLARNRASQALEQQMEIARSYTASLVKRRAELQKLRADSGAKGLAPAEAQELATLQAEIDVQNAAMAQKKQDLGPGGGPLHIRTRSAGRRLPKNSGTSRSWRDKRSSHENSGREVRRAALFRRLPRSRSSTGYRQRSRDADRGGARSRASPVPKLDEAAVHAAEVREMGHPACDPVTPRYNSMTA
jgi:hypothetical protein